MELTDPLEKRGLLADDLKHRFENDYTSITWGLLASFLGSLIVSLLMLVKHFTTKTAAALREARKQAELQAEIQRMKEKEKATAAEIDTLHAELAEEKIGRRRACLVAAAAKLRRGPGGAGAWRSGAVRLNDLTEN